jgi:signal transduction histidine kinase
MRFRRKTVFSNPSIMARRPPSAGWLVLTFVAVGMAFLAATIFAEYRSAAIDHMALEIADNAAPSIKLLAAARTDLRHLQLLAEDYVNGATRGVEPDPQDLEAARAQLETDLQRYLERPLFAGEKELWREVGRKVPRVHATLDRVLEQVKGSDPRKAREVLRGNFRQAVDEASSAILTSLDFDAAQSQELARRIEQTRSHTTSIAFLLDSLCIALSIAAAFMVNRAVRSYTGLLESHGRLLERRAEELEWFAARVAHDILSPLGTVGLALDGALMTMGEEAAVRDFLTRGKSSLAQIRQLVDGLLKFARSGAQPERGARAGVRPVVEACIAELEPFAAEAGAHLSVPPFPDCEVAASPGVLASLLLNLIRNAIKYIGDGPTRAVTVRVAPGRDRARFEVEDTGPGIPPELGDRIFEPHVRGHGLKQPGIGLGLATVKRLAEAHGGSVGFTSRLGQGSLFWFELSRPTPEERSTPSAEELVKTGGRAGSA